MNIKLFSSATALTVLRISVGIWMLVYHGWPKLQNFAVYSGQFPDPIFLGSQLSLLLVIFAEVFCSICVIFGVAIRAVLIPLIITMLVAVFIIHGADPMAKKELACLYLFIYSALFLGGAGNFKLNVANVLPKNKWIVWVFDSGERR
tara:strand:- start:158 stop:598 length:441 start_codon:yes stop_codon:yes gene_type:complete